MKNWKTVKDKIETILQQEAIATFKPMAQKALKELGAKKLVIDTSMGVDYIEIDDGLMLSYYGMCEYDPGEWPNSKALKKLAEELIRYNDELGWDMKYSVGLGVKI